MEGSGPLGPLLTRLKLAQERWLPPFVLADAGFVLQRQANTIQPVQQAVTTERIDAESVTLVARHHFLPVQIHGKADARLGGDPLKQRIHFGFA